MRFGRILALCVLMIPAVACRHSQSIPPELAGNWVTDDPRYAGKNMIIDKDGYITLITNPESKPKAERIDKMTSTKEAGAATYVFETTDIAGAHDKITLTYRAANGGELRLSHPNQVVWKRATEE